jgi:hypothetical protein
MIVKNSGEKYGWLFVIPKKGFEAVSQTAKFCRRRVRGAFCPLYPRSGGVALPGTTGGVECADDSPPLVSSR